jgi:membrane fusion protein (multidrug efflux system)
MKKILGIIALVALIAFVAFKLTANKETINKNSEYALNIEKYKFVPVTVYKVAEELNEKSVEEIGSFESRQELTVSANASGRVVSFNLKEGQFISKGALIAQLDYAALSNQMNTAKLTLANAKKDLERVQNANQVGATTKMQIEQAQLQIDNIQSNITNINEQIKFYTVTAPMSGYVTKTLIQQGSYVMPGTPIVDLVDIGTIKMVVKVDERIVPLLKVGKSVPVTTEVFPGKTFNGKISSIGIIADNAKKFSVEIDLPNTGNQLKVGMYGNVTFDNISSTDAIFIPRNSIVGSINDAKVYTVNADSTVKLIPIKVGGYLGNNIEVKEGLQSGDQVVLMGQINLKDGAKVSIVK